MGSSNIIFVILGKKSQKYNYEIDSKNWELLGVNCTGSTGNPELFSYSTILSNTKFKKKT